MTLTPHELIKMGAHHLVMATFHSLDLRFYPVPLGFYVLGMDPSCRVDKLDAVVHRLVLSHRGEMLNIIVCCPHITPHYCSWTNMSLGYGEESGSITGGN